MSILRKDKNDPPPPPGRRNRYKRPITILLIVVVALLGTAAALLAAKWPFTPAKVTARLESATSASVRIGGFQTKYFPPGCVIEALELRPHDGAGGAPLMTVRRLTILSNYRQILLHQRIEVIHLEDVHVAMGRRQELKSNSGRENGNGASNQSSNNSTSVAEVVVDGGVIEYPRHERPALIFNLHRLTLDNVVQGKRIAFHVTIDNPLPPGNVRADGQFDPWNVSDVKETPLSGTYRFTDAKLSTLAGIAGTLSSQGTFAGPADALRVQGTTDTPDYQVKSAGHPLHLRTEFQAMVNCANGDVGLQSIRGRFEKTSFGVAGDVTGKTNARSKVASLQVADPGGRIEDWLRLLTSGQTPAMTGPISFQAHMTIPGGPKPFMRRVRMEGDFGITDVAFTNEETQERVTELSLRAQGQKVPDRKRKKEALPKITGKLSGHVEMLNGVARFSNLSYSLPGVVATVHGTYSFNDEAIDLHGEMQVDTKFSNTASGTKSLLTRAAEGLLAKGRGKGEILPVKLTGTYGHPSYGLDK
jgi:hypothetical protein